jgi:ribose transport system permease protein
MEATTMARGARAASESFWGELRFRFAARYRVVWVALAALLILTGATESELFKPQSLEFITALAGVLAIAAAGQMLVIMLGGIDLSVPAVMALAGAIVVKQTQGADDQLLVAVLEGCAAAAVIGLLNGVLVVFAKLNAFIVTLAMNGIVLGAIVIWAGSVYSASGAAPKGLIDFTSDALGPITIFGLLALVLLFAIGFLLRNTGVGRAYVATGTNPNAARIIGIHTRTHQIGGFVVASILFMVAGILLAGVVRTPNIVVGETYQLTTIVAVALGGASLAGGPASALCTGAACLFVAVLSQYLTLGDFEPGIKVLANGVVLVLAVVLVTSGTGHRPSLRALLEWVRFRGLRGPSDSGESG